MSEIISPPNSFEVKRIAVAGANGFVGRALIPALAQKFPNAKIICLTRSAGKISVNSQVEWHPCDIFSLLDCERVLEGVDAAFYLVHSMLPSAHLDQGNFSDHDLILSDNFARASAKRGVKQIIYLGGLIPNVDVISEHLESRKEVEHTLGFAGTPLTALRAGLIVGARCSSFTIVRRLVRRLPVMLCPRWMRSRCQPIDINDVIASLAHVVGDSQHLNKTYDIGGPSILSYRNILRETAKIMGRKNIFLDVPLVTPRLSRMWVSLVTGAPRNLVYPLVESLKHDMTVDARYWLRIPDWKYATFGRAVDRSVRELKENIRSDRTVPQAFRKTLAKQEQRYVRSVQRLPLPMNLRAKDVAEMYMKWLPSFLPWLVKTEVNGNRVVFFLSIFRMKLLELEYSEERSSIARQLLYIRDGFLAKKVGKGRLEFREVLQGRYILAAVHEFYPVLPWYVYRLSQAVVHLMVMRSFGRYLKNYKSHQP